jgi:hypothetical protein
MSSANEEALRSLQRRLRFATMWQLEIQVMLSLLGVSRSGPRRERVLKLLHAGGSLAFDLLESLRVGEHVSHLSQPNEAALAVPDRLHQQPRHRGYWYDSDRHSLVGLHLALDLNRHQGRSHVLESNCNPSVRRERRRLYDSDLDPFISELVLHAQRQGFERLVFVRHTWQDFYVEEFERATRVSGLEVTGASFDRSTEHFLVALPDPLAPKTMYVLWSYGGQPLSRFMGDKIWSARWLRETIEAEGNPCAHLAYVPTFDHLVLPEPPGARWPNLVVKLADRDKGEFVVMGRFQTEEDARRGLQLREDDPHAIPGVFKLNFPPRAIRRYFPTSVTAYQPFIPPEVIENRARKVRLHIYVSPLFTTFLSAHATVGGEELPDHLPVGLVEKSGPFCCNFNSGGWIVRVEPEVEEELRVMADEFGRMANLAITQKLETGP